MEKIPEKGPKHIAIIMDGNRRWAKKNGLQAIEGHKAGAKTLKRIVNYAYEIGLENLTVYAFSTENWKRQEKEIKAIMKLLYDYTEEIKSDKDKDICVKIYGDTSKLSEKIKRNLQIIEENSKDKKRLTFGICFNYGGREEIINAVKNICLDVKSGSVSINEIDENLFKTKLYTKEVPDPDLVIRTSGESRTSNFLPWQTVYSELYFPDIYWPDFNENELDKAINEYINRNRRYGK